jgi:hypothetical protein
MILLPAGPLLFDTDGPPNRPINSKRIACIVRPSKSTQFAFSESGKGRRSDDRFGEQRQGFQNVTNLSQIVCIGLTMRLAVNT